MCKLPDRAKEMRHQQEPIAINQITIKIGLKPLINSGNLK